MPQSADKSAESADTKPLIEIIPGNRKRPTVAALIRQDGSTLRLSID